MPHLDDPYITLTLTLKVPKLILPPPDRALPSQRDGQGCSGDAYGDAGPESGAAGPAPEDAVGLANGGDFRIVFQTGT